MHKKRKHVIAEKSESSKKQKNIFKDKSFIKTTSSIVGVIILLVFFVYGFGLMGSEEDRSADTGSDKQVKLDFYVMSQCPYGTEVVDAINPVLEKIGDTIDFNLEFIAQEKGDGKFNSLHGQSEVEGNIVQLCAEEYNPDKYMDFIVCMNKNANNIPGNWESCAKKHNLDSEKIETCYQGDEGKQLLSESLKKAQKAGASASPTIFIDGEQYNGGRKTNDFLSAICGRVDYEPEACRDIPKPKTVKLTIINDKRCDECNTDQLTQQLKALFPGLKVVDFDYSYEKGKKLYKENDLENLPALLFDESVKESSGYSKVQGYLKKTPTNKYHLAVGAKFDPTAEICDNGKDDTGNGKIDCKDPTCENKLECREEKPKKLDLFVMSQCPYGTKALDSMDEVIDNFDNLDFNIHYIAQEKEDGSFSSLHGQPEVNENIRELCAIEYYPEDYQYMDYIWCRNKDIKSSDWQSCAEEADMDVQTIKECSQGQEGKDLLSENIKLAQDLGISASPTWMVNNRYQFSGIDAETVRKNLCKHNEEMEGCDTTLSSQDAPSGSC